MEHVPASMSISFPKCSVDVPWRLEGLQVIVRIYLEFSILQKKKNMQKSVFLPEAQRKLDLALVALFQETKQEICLDPTRGSSKCSHALVLFIVQEPPPTPLIVISPPPPAR